MSVQMLSSEVELRRVLKRIPDIVHAHIGNELSRLGDECDRQIRSRDGGWHDRTGNLRSSIGYAVFDNGRKIAESQFPTVLQGSLGSAKGRAMVDEIARQYSATVALVVVAAMDYAEFVEAIEGKDVLASAVLHAEHIVQERMMRAAQNAEVEIQQQIDAL